MGLVVAATHLKLEQPVAIKVLLPEVLANSEAVERFAREARAAAQIKGEHVVRVLDVGELPGDKIEPPKGQLMITLQTDMALPKDVDQVHVEILSFGSVQFANTYEVGAGKLLIPATLGLIVGEDPARPVSIRILALQQGKARMLREVVTTVPAQRVATLRIPIQWLCDGSVTEPTPGQYSSTCPEGQTCLAGRCTEQKVEEATLPSYDPALIFGGGTGTGDGACFDTEGCFAGTSLVTVDAKDCSVEKPASGAANLALIPRDRKAGICDAQRCYVPLDRSEDAGFREANGRLLLPPRVCELISSGALEGVVLTTQCPTKTDALPTCGPWSSTGKSAQPGNPLLAACNAHQEAACSYLERCDTGAWSSFGGSQCKERGALFCGAILEFPGLGVSEATFQEATKLLAGSTCNSKALRSVLYGLLGGAEGSLPQGSPCLVNAQCQSSLCLVQQQNTCGVCVNLLSDNQHCGACNNACSPEHGCTKGVCSGAQ